MVNRHTENNRVGQDIRDSIPDEDTSEIEAFARYRKIPRTWNRGALEDTDEDEHQGPDCSDCTYDPCRNFESTQWKDAAVHDQNGDLCDSKADDIDDLVCEYSFANCDERLEGHMGSLKAETMLNHYKRVSTILIVHSSITHLSHSEQNSRW